MSRSPKDLLWQTRKIELALVGTISREDAAAAGTAQAAWDIKPGRSTHRAAAPFTTFVHARVSEIPYHLLANLPRAVATLDAETRLVLRLLLTLGEHPRTVAATVGKSPSWVGRKRRAGVDALARQLWTDTGELRVPP